MNIKKILVVIDPQGDNTHVIQRARLFSIRFNAKVELAVFDYRLSVVLGNFYSSDKLDQAKHEFLLQKLKPLGLLAEEMGIPQERITCHIEWAQPLYRAILSRVEQINADLIIKQTHHHNVINRSIFTNTDWHLIRESSVPVLFVKAGEYDSAMKLGAAVDPIKESGEDGVCPLSHSILNLAHQLCTTLPAELNVIHCYEVVPSGLILEMDDVMPAWDDVRQAVRHRHELSMKKLMSADLEASAKVTFEEGDIREKLPRLVSELNLDLVVMGGVSRSALERMAVGSTAEFVLDRLASDVLVIK